MKKLISRIIVFVLALATIMSTVVINTTTAFAADSNIRTYISRYNTSVTAIEGESYAALVRRLQPVVKAQVGASKKSITVPIVYEEAGQYVHANSKGRVKITFTYNGAKTSMYVKVKTTTTKLSVKATGSLYAYQTLTPSMLRKVIKVANTYSNGKKVANFKGYTSSQIGKKIVANKKGYKKITISNGEKKASVNVKVVSLKRIYVSHTFASLTENTSISSTSVKKATTLKGVYSNGKIKTLTNYSVSAPKKATGKSVKITFSCGKIKTTVRIPVVKKPVTPVDPKPEQPTPSKPEDPKPVDPKPDQPSTEEPGTEEPGTEEPIEYQLTLKNGSDNKIKVNGATMQFTDGVATETFEAGTEINLSTTDSNSDRFVQWTNETTGEVLSTSKSFVYTIESDVTIVAVYEKICTLTVIRQGGKGKVMLDGESLDFYNNIAEIVVVPGRYTLSVVSTDDYDFVNWTNSLGLELTTSMEYSVSVASDTSVTANFIVADKTVMVTYQYDSGAIIDSQAVMFGETLTPPTNVFQQDASLKGWKIGDTLYEGDVDSPEFYNGEEKLSEAIKALTEARQDVTIVASFEKNPVYYRVSISGTGAILKDAAGNELDPDKILSGTHVYLDAIVPDGLVFNYLHDVDNDIIVTYREHYDFFIGANRNFEVVCSEEEVPAEPKVLLRGEGYTAVSPNLSVLTTIDLPAGYSNLEWGVLFSLEEKEDFQYDTEGVFKVQDTDKNVINSNYADSSITLQDASMFDNHMVMWVRAYARIQTSSGTETIYSRIVKIQL